MPEIYQALTEEAYMRHSHLGAPITGKTEREVEFYLPKDPKTVEFAIRQSLLFWLEGYDDLVGEGNARIASHENPLPTACAGSVSFFTDKDGGLEYVSFSQKDNGAQRDPGFRTSRNGFPSYEGDWVALNHIYRETFEEGIFVTKDGELVLAEDEKFDDIIYLVADLLASKAKLRIKGTKRVPMTFFGGKDKLTIYREDQVQEVVHHGIISWTPETGFNFIKPLYVNYPISELNLVDGETLPDGTPLCRDVCVIKLRELKGKVFGDEIRETVYRYKNGRFTQKERRDRFLIDKVSRSVLNQTMVDGEPVYPLDWMVESHDFLSDPRVLGESFCFGWSELEKRLKVK